MRGRAVAERTREESEMISHQGGKGQRHLPGVGEAAARGAREVEGVDLGCMRNPRREDIGRNEGCSRGRQRLGAQVFAVDGI